MGHSENFCFMCNDKNMFYLFAVKVMSVNITKTNESAEQVNIRM